MMDRFSDKLMGYIAREKATDSRRSAGIVSRRQGGEQEPRSDLPLHRRLSIDGLLDKGLARIRKTIVRVRLVVVRSDAIDKAGEEGLGLRHFDPVKKLGGIKSDTAAHLCVGDWIQCRRG